VFSIELITVFLVGPLCLLLAYGFIVRANWFHFLQVLVCTAEIYGGWMTFVPEWLLGSPNLSPDPMHKWLYLAVMNGIWVIIPLALLYNSFIAISKSQLSLSSFTKLKSQ